MSVGTSKSYCSYPRYGSILRRSQRQARGPQDRAGDAEREAAVEGQVADPDEALLPDRVAGEQLVEPGQARVHHVAELEDPLLGALGEVLDDAAGADEGVVHAQPGEELEQVQDLLALPEAVGHAGERAELHPAGRERDEVRADPVDLHEEHPGDLGPRRDLDAEQPLDRHAVGGLGEQRREVVAPGHERDALRPGAVLAVLLDAGVQVADDQAAVGHGLAGDLQDEAEHAVRGRVLRPHVDDDALVAGALAEQLVPVATGDRVDGALGGLAGGGGVGGSVVGTSVLTCRPSAGRAAGSRRPCTRPGCRPAGSSCAAGGRSSRPA